MAGGQSGRRFRGGTHGGSPPPSGHRGDRPLERTQRQFRLIDTLIRQPGRAFGRSELISSALGDDAIVLERTIDVHIRAVRRALGDVADVIETVRGVGYRFRDPNAA